MRLVFPGQWLSRGIVQPSDIRRRELGSDCVDVIGYRYLGILKDLLHGCALIEGTRPSIYANHETERVCL